MKSVIHNNGGMMEQVKSKQVVLAAFPRFQVRKNYSPNGSTYRAFDGKNSKARPISDWVSSRTKAIAQAASRITKLAEGR